MPATSLPCQGRHGGRACASSPVNNNNNPTADGHLLIYNCSLMTTENYLIEIFPKSSYALATRDIPTECRRLPGSPRGMQWPVILWITTEANHHRASFAHSMCSYYAARHRSVQSFSKRDFSTKDHAWMHFRYNFILRCMHDMAPTGASQRIMGTPPTCSSNHPTTPDVSPASVVIMQPTMQTISRTPTLHNAR